jgi:NAD(P)-dependent dehydrogenase (short-subunit alcohol dehydrogenase family)
MGSEYQHHDDSSNLVHHRFLARPRLGPRHCSSGSGRLGGCNCPSPEQLAPIVERYGERVLPVALDVTNGAAAEAAIVAAVRRFGRIDVLVNNAGYANIAPIETAPEEDFRRQFETNFWGVYHVTKAALPVL